MGIISTVALRFENQVVAISLGVESILYALHKCRKFSKVVKISILLTSPSSCKEGFLLVVYFLTESRDVWLVGLVMASFVWIYTVTTLQCQTLVTVMPPWRGSEFVDFFITKQALL